ncbi:MAG: type II toxin-antitoxin system VapC family toxin [Gemmatimonas sp.]
MRLLLDTHVVIWWDAGQQLSAVATKAIQDADEVFGSAASAWEIAIKSALGKISSKRTIAVAAAQSGLDELPVAFAHSAQLALLPTHHHDPFDRMIIAQVMVEGLTLVTRNGALQQYGSPTIRA